MEKKTFKGTKRYKRKVASILLSILMMIGTLAFSQSEAKAAGARGWIYNGFTWNYLRADGIKQVGWLQTGGKWYYLGHYGDMETGWVFVDESWHYFNAGGDMATGWKLVGGKWYRMGYFGEMQTGWALVDENWYYLGCHGDMQTGWKFIGGSWYYFNAGGDMATGWIQDNGKWYYLNSNGDMAVSTTTPDGYAVGADGARIGAYRTADSSMQFSMPVPNDITWIMFEVDKDGVMDQRIVQAKNGMLNSKIYFRNGAGTYTVCVLGKSGDRGGFYGDNLAKFEVENTDNRDMRLLLPEDGVESDDPEIVALAQEITKGLSTDMEKTRAIHDWVASNIAFDAEAYFSNNMYFHSSLETLHSKKAFCDGYCKLNVALHRAVGIPAKIASGYFGSDYSSEKHSNHAWNQVFVDGNWIVEDTTYDAGYVNHYTHKFVFRLSHKYFNPSKEEFEKDHHLIP